MKYSFLFLLACISLASCKQIDANKQIDEGEFKKNTYTSNELGWTIKIPEGWKITSREQNEKFEKKGLEAMEDLVDGEIDVSQLKDLIGFQKNQFNMFQSNTEPFKEEYDGEWEENNALIKALIFNTYQNQGIKVDSSKTTSSRIGGLNFETYKFTIYAPNGDVILNQIMYSRLINELSFGVNINYNNEADKNEMLSSWKKSKFKKK
ncbi:hypothetical protein DIS18_10520 [Algibacter marinivivus]|uniref:DUF1795 domain-containing protein n=1 Tax=Algibacter marinivivus TaxID=2100723 RepID=A0A2U2X4F3_9FLAO|nr:hypothetical protein [Algibacter marinivivus]PWH82663.1 hypothetical protein DIS18_10520 [Algibacter marinivivus]